jgi:hypothetical protein
MFLSLIKLMFNYSLNYKMKKLIIYLLIGFSGLTFYSCDKPGPTELIDDTADNNAEYEVLGKDLNDEYYSNGFDTTGVSQDLRNLPNLISVSGIKVTDQNGNNEEFSYAQTVFFDNTKPVYDSNHRLLAYQTIIPGTVKFDDMSARIIPYRIHFRENGVLKDTLLGNKYVLFSGRHGQGDQFRYRHNSTIRFNIDIFFGPNINFDIPTPVEIGGAVGLLGSRDNNDLRALLQWNRGNTEKITIIIAARLRDRQIMMPLYRVRTRDSGKLLIPARFINNIPFERFDKLMFTFIRRFERTFNGANGDGLLVSSQSIHNIIVNLP